MRADLRLGALLLGLAACGDEGPPAIGTRQQALTSGWWGGNPPITQNYGCTDVVQEPPGHGCAHWHAGLDIGIACGVPLQAAAFATVVSVGAGEPGYGPYWPRIRLDTAQGQFDVILGHVQKTFVHAGDSLSPGQVISEVGTLGNSTGCHLHFEVRPAGGRYGSDVDPHPFLNPLVIPPNRPPQGSLDRADCQQVSGWAQDPDVPMQPIQAHVYLNGQAGQPGAIGIPLLANQHRPDLCGAYGCDHGFFMPWPRQLLDGQSHEVNAYGIDAQGGANTRLAGSPRQVQCAPPPLSGVRRWVPSGAVQQSWKFDGFWDVTRYPQAQIDQVAAGPQWPDAPVAVQAMGHSEVWVIDGEVKRKVPSPAALLAWRLQVATVAEVDHYRQGPDLRPQPELVQGDAAVYLLDDDPGQPVSGPQGGAVVPVGDRIDVTGGCQAVRGGAGRPGGAGLLLLLLAAGLAYPPPRRGAHARRKTTPFRAGRSSGGL